MMKKKNLFLCLLLTALLAALLAVGIPAAAQEIPAIVDSGFCGGSGDGTNLTWTLDSSGVLTVGGAGTMADYETEMIGRGYTTAPWGGSLEKDLRIKTVVVGDGVASIGANAFSLCIDLTDVTFGNSLTEIGEDAFRGCSLVQLTVPDSVTAIGAGAFSGCTDLKRVVIGSGMTRLEEDLFYSCVGLRDITIPANVTSIASGALDCSGALHIRCFRNSAAHRLAEDYGLAYALLDGTEEENTVSGTVENLTWTIDLMDCVLTLDYEGEMPQFVSGNPPWGERMAYVHTAIVSEGAASLSGSAFFNCIALSDVILPDSLTGIGSAAFYWCDDLTNVTLGRGLKTIGSGAFKWCTHLKELSLPEGLETVGAEAFFRCSALTELTLPASVTEIGVSAFYGCASLTEMTIPDGVTTLGGGGLFYECTSLQSVTIPKSLISVGYGIFGVCPSLTEIRIDPENPAFTADENSCVYNKEKTEFLYYPQGRQDAAFSVPAGVTKIAHNAFSTGNLKRVTVPSGVTELGESAFSFCSNLEAVVLPAELTAIGANAFKECYHLTDVYYAGTQEEWNRIAVESGNEKLLEADLHCGVSESDLCNGDPLGHTPGETVIENVFPAVCTADGGYDEILYCLKCGGELSRTHVTERALGHSWGEWEVVKQATVNEEGLLRRVCQNDPSHVEEEAIPKLQPRTSAFQQFIRRIVDFFNNIIDWFRSLFRF